MRKPFSGIFSSSVFLLVFIYVSMIQAQVDTVWTKTFWGLDFEKGNSVQQTADGGYIIVGSTSSFGAGNTDIWLIKTDSEGDTLWTRTYGGSEHDNGNFIQQTEDGGYIIIGATSSFGAGWWDAWLIRTDVSGDSIWSKTYGGFGNEEGYSGQQTLDGGFIITGYTDSFGAAMFDFWLVKTDSSGDTLWTKTYGSGAPDCGYSVQQTIDEGYIITGYIQSFTPGFHLDIWLVKTDESGDTLWTRKFGGTSTEHGYSVQQTPDEGFIILGITSSFGDIFSDVWLVRTNAEGDTLWTKSYGGSDFDIGYSLQQTTDEGYILTGSTSSFGAGNHDVWLIKTNAFGDTLWTKTFGGTDNDEGKSVLQTPDGGYLILGSTSSSGAGGMDVWLIKTTAGVDKIKQNENIGNLEYDLYQNYPNPFNPKTTFSYSIPETDRVTISIYSISGQIMESKTMNLNPGVYRYEFDGTAYSSSIYFYKISTHSGYTAQRKMLLLK